MKQPPVFEPSFRRFAIIVPAIGLVFLGLALVANEAGGGFTTFLCLLLAPFLAIRATLKMPNLRDAVVFLAGWALFYDACTLLVWVPAWILDH